MVSPAKRESLGEGFCCNFRTPDIPLEKFVRFFDHLEEPATANRMRRLVPGNGVSVLLSRLGHPQKLHPWPILKALRLCDSIPHVRS